MTSVTDTAAGVTETDGLARRMERIGEEVAAPAADEVDLTGRFPAETIDALQSERLLSALVPEAFGGMGASVAEVSDGLVALGRHCASSAMVVAMHHIQVACLVRHGRSTVAPRLSGGPGRRTSTCWPRPPPRWARAATCGSSVCAVDVADGTFRLEKQAPVISYGQFADAVLATARRSADSPRERPGAGAVPPPRARAGAGRGVERPRVPGHLQPRVLLRAQRRRRPGPRRPLRRPVHPDHAAHGPHPVELAVAGDRHRRPRPRPAVRPVRGPQAPGHDPGGRAAAGRHHRAAPAVHRPGPRLGRPLSSASRTIPSGCRPWASPSP